MRDWLVSTVGGGATALAIVVAIISLAGVLGGAFTSYLVAQKTVYINAITAERMKWITLIRANIAAVIAHLTVIQAAKLDRSSIKDEQLTNTFKAMNELSKTIELQLNPDGQVDRSIIYIINELYKSTAANSSVHIPDITKVLIAHTQWLLKDEWERVKFEARGPVGKLRSIIKNFFRARRYRKFLESNVGSLPESI